MIVFIDIHLVVCVLPALYTTKESGYRQLAKTALDFSKIMCYVVDEVTNYDRTGTEK